MTMNREFLINSILAIALITVPLIALGMDEPFIITLATKVAIFAMAGVGLNLVLGYGGLVSFGHAAFFGIGGYAAGILASHALNYEPIMESPFLIEGTTQMIVIWIVALVVSALVALVIGAITLRTSGVYFIMITLAFAQMIYYFAISWPAYGGEDGLSIYVRNGFPGINTLDPISFFALCAVMLAIAMVFSAVLIRSRFGLALQGARQNAQRMTAVGIAPFRIRLVAFVISAMITALAGA
ncbi:MAG: branched-chain amino acid ABC transporter permease, partial [Thalassospira sp.]